MGRRGREWAWAAEKRSERVTDKLDRGRWADAMTGLRREMKGLVAGRKVSRKRRQRKVNTERR